MGEETLVRVEGLAKKFCRDLGRSLRYGIWDIAAELRPLKQLPSSRLRPGEFWALQDVSFELKRGEALGVLGANGAGKSTLLKLLDGLLKPDKGRITLRGKVGALIDLGAGFNPILSGRENIYINAAVLGLDKKETGRVIDEIIEFAAIGDAIDAPARSYSTGMWMRLGFAVATHLRPDVLLVDEVLAVGDLAFRRKCLQHIQKYLNEGGCLVFVSHDPWMTQCICGRGLLLDHGRVSLAGTAVEAVDGYFRALLPEPPVACSDNGGGKLERYFSCLRGMPGNHAEAASGEDSRSAAAGDGPTGSEYPVAIDEVEVFASGGGPIRQGCDMRIVVHYRSSRAIDPAYWGFLIYTRDLQTCVTVAGTGFSYTGGARRIESGSGRIACTLPRLSLVAGTYALKVQVGDPRTGGQYSNFGWDNKPLAFRVTAAANEISNVYAMTGSLVEVEVLWDE